MSKIRLGGASLSGPEESTGRRINRMSRDQLPALPLTNAYGDFGVDEHGRARMSEDEDPIPQAHNEPTRGDPMDGAIGPTPDASGLGGSAPHPAARAMAGRPAAPRQVSPEELMRQAEAMLQANQDQHAAQMAKGSATSPAMARETQLSPGYGHDQSDGDWLDEYMRRQ